MINQQGFRSLLVTTPSTDALQAHTRTRNTQHVRKKNSKLLRLHLLDTEPAGTNAGRDDSYWGLYFLMEDIPSGSSFMDQTKNKGYHCHRKSDHWMVK